MKNKIKNEINYGYFNLKIPMKKLAQKYGVSINKIQYVLGYPKEVPNAPLPAETKKQIREEYIKGTSVPELCITYNIWPITVYKYLKGIKRKGREKKNYPYLSAEAKERIRTAYAQGVPVPMLAKEYKVWNATIYNCINKTRKKRKVGRVLTLSEVGVMKKEYKQGVSVKKLAAKYGITPHTVYKKLGPILETLTPEEKIAVVEKKKAGLRAEDLASQYHVGIKQIYSILKKEKENDSTK